MKSVGSPRVLLSDMNDALRRQISWQKRPILLTVLTGLALVALLAAVQSPSAQTWLIGFAQKAHGYDAPLLGFGEDVRSWNTWTTRATEWETDRARDDELDRKNWAGRQMMRKQRAEGSLWWDERAELYFTSKLMESQFPANCSQAHWIAHYDFVAGLLSSVHMFLLPLFFAMVRGHTLVPISEPKHHPAFDGCGPNLADKNMQCYFNITTCNPGEDPARLAQILASQHDSLRTTWEETLMEDADFFPPGGVTVTQTFKQPTWETKTCVRSSSFSSFLEAYTFHKLSLWDTMGRHGKVGVVTDLKSSSSGTKGQCSANQQEDSRGRRVDMVMTSLMSSWMLNQMPNNVKLVAEKIMSRYVDELGHPSWKPPVLAIHIRQTDKSVEDPYFVEHGVYRPIEDYAVHMKRMEKEFGFEWPSVFLISDSATARESFSAILNGNLSADLQQQDQKKKRFIMYDWIEDDLNLQERFHDHSKVPRALKHDMQTHFLATLYILQKIADHSILTYSSNVGRFIGEIMAAKHRLAFVGSEGPLVTSLDYPWYWA